MYPLASCASLGKRTLSLPRILCSVDVALVVVFVPLKLFESWSVDPTYLVDWRLDKQQRWWGCVNFHCMQMILWWACGFILGDDWTNAISWSHFADNDLKRLLDRLWKKGHEKLVPRKSCFLKEATLLQRRRVQKQVNLNSSELRNRCFMADSLSCMYLIDRFSQLLIDVKMEGRVALFKYLRYH